LASYIIALCAWIVVLTVVELFDDRVVDAVDERQAIKIGIINISKLTVK